MINGGRGCASFAELLISVPSTAGPRLLESKMNSLERRLAVLLPLVVSICYSPLAQAQVAARAWFPPGEAADIVGFRYKTKTVQNPTELKIIFGFNRLSGDGIQPAPYFFETNLYTDRLTYPDGTCTTWPMSGQHIAGQASIRLAFADYVKAGRTGMKTFDASMLPRQTYEIDGISGLWKTDGISQQDLTGSVIGVEITRAGNVTTKSGWKCTGDLDNSVFRQWNAVATFGGASHAMAFATLEETGRYAFPGEVMNFATEFMEYTGILRARVWDAEILREGWPYWIAANRWMITQRSDKPAGTYGTRRATEGGRPAIEIANDATAAYAPWESILDLGLPSIASSAPDLLIDSFSAPGASTLVAGGTILTSVLGRNAGPVAAGPFKVGFGFDTGSSPSVFSSLMSPTLCDVPAGLAADQSFTCAVPVVVPLGSGTFRFSAFADVLGSVVETDNSNNVSTMAVSVDIIPCPLPSAFHLPEGFSAGGIRFESLAADGSVHARLQYRSSLDVTNGTIRSVGPGYVDANAFYPWVMLDASRATVLVHPEASHDASIGVPICTSGRYRIQGSFARANSVRYAGDGVGLLVTRTIGSGGRSVLVSGSISSNHDVAADYFSGTGVLGFDLSAELSVGDLIRFSVSTGASQDGGFDATAIRTSVVPDKTSSRRRPVRR